MAAAPEYFTTPRIGHARVTAGVTATDGSGSLTAVTWVGTVTANWMLTKIIVEASSATGVGNPADCLIHIFITDGTTHRRIRSFDPGDIAVGSTTALEGQFEIPFGPEFVFTSAWSLEVGVSATPTAGNIDFVVLAQMA